MSTSSPTGDPHRTQILYEENAKVAATFWEWRNKLLAFCFTAAGALFVIAAWVHKNIDHELAAVPLLVGATISIGCIRLENRNNYILRQCYHIGAAIERGWISPIDDPEPSAAVAAMNREVARATANPPGREEDAVDGTSATDASTQGQMRNLVARSRRRLAPPWQWWSAADPDTWYNEAGVYTMLAVSPPKYFRTMRWMFLAVALLDLGGAVFTVTD